MPYQKLNESDSFTGIDPNTILTKLFYNEIKFRIEAWLQGMDDGS